MNNKLKRKDLIWVQSSLLKSYILDFYDEGSSHDRKIQSQMAIITISDFLKMLGVEEIEINRVDVCIGITDEIVKKLEKDFRIKTRKKVQNE